jgi:hypothetical protein
MIDYDEIRKQIAIQHNFLLDKDDPLMVAAGMHEAILSLYAELLNEQNKKSEKAILASVKQELAEGRVTVKQHLSDCALRVNEQAFTGVKQAMEEGRAGLRKDILAVWERIEAARKVTVIAAGVTCACAAIVLGVLVGSV